MKTTVIIENGRTQIKLTPENVFDADVLKKMYESKYDAQIPTVELRGSHYDRSYQLNINLTEKL